LLLTEVGEAGRDLETYRWRWLRFFFAVKLPVDAGDLLHPGAPLVMLQL
jgi:hypothetical protein